MNSREKDEMENYISLLENNIDLYQSYDNSSKLFDLLENVYALYSKKIPQISDEYERVRDQNSLIVRCSKTVLALLKNFINSNYIEGENELIINTKKALSSFPQSLDSYNSGLDKYFKQEFSRNVLDDMRLSLELLLKTILNNSNSLENQISLIGAKLKESQISSELINMLQKLLNYYAKFQNQHVKHNDAFNENEIEFIIELTSIFMKIIINSLDLV